MSATLTLRTACAARSHTTRVEAWNELPAAFEAEPVPLGTIPAFVEEIVSTLESFSGRAANMATEAAVAKIAARSDLGVAFTRALIRALASRAAAMTPLGKLRALKLLCCAVATAFEAIGGTVEAPAEGFAELVALQASLLLGSLVGCRRTSQARAARRAIAALLAAVPTAAACYTAALLAQEAPNDATCALLGCFSSQPAAVLGSRDAWLKMYVTAVLSVNSPVPACARLAFAPLLAATTAEEWSGQLLPAVVRCLKRAPDAALAPLPELFVSLPDGLNLDAGLAAIADAVSHPLPITDPSPDPSPDLSTDHSPDR